MAAWARRAALIGVSLAMAGVARGQTAAAERTVTLEEALAIARRQNRDLHAAQARLEQAAADLSRAYASLMPQLTTTGRYTHNYKQVSFDFSTLNQGLLGLAEAIRTSTSDPGEAMAIARFEEQVEAAQLTPIVIQKREQLDWFVNGRMPLVAPAAYPALRAARATERAARASYAANNADVLLRVAEAYYLAAGADELIRARTDAIAVARRTLEDASAHFTAGSATRVDVMRAQLAVLRAEQAAADTEVAAARAYRALARLLGTRERLRVVPAAAPPSRAAAGRDLVASALARRPEIAAGRERVAALAAQKRAFAWQWAPSLSAFGNFNLGNYQSFSGDRYAWSVGLELGWVIYDGGVRDAQRRRAAAEEREQAAELDLLRDTVADQVLDARDELRTRRRAFESARQEARLTRETLELVRVQYGAGAASQLDLLQAQDAVVSADVAVARARFDVALATLRLERAIGDFPGPAGGRAPRPR